MVKTASNNGFVSPTTIDNKVIVITFVGAFALFYILVLDFNLTRSFFVLAGMLVVYGIYTSSEVENQQAHREKNTFISDVEKMIVGLKEHEFPTELSYYVHKAPQKLVYIHQNTDMVNVIYNLRFLLTYDKFSLLHLVIMLEHFMKIHYNIMIGKYDPNTYIDILNDIRRNVLNQVQSNHFQIPDVSRVYESKSGDIAKDVNNSALQLQSIIYKLIKVVHKKYKKQIGTKHYHGPHNFDTQFKEHYHLY